MIGNPGYGKGIKNAAIDLSGRFCRIEGAVQIETGLYAKMGKFIHFGSHNIRYVIFQSRSGKSVDIIKLG